MLTLIGYSLVGGLFSLLGGLLLLARADFAKKYLTSLLAFAAGAFLAVSFLDLLPEAIEMVDEVHPLFMWLLGGIILFFALERLLMQWMHRQASAHDHSEHTESLPALVILGDTLHNFLDGVVIALAFLADPNVGLVTALAVAAHEIPQEIGDFAILLNSGWRKSRIIFVNILSSLATVVGALLGYWLGVGLESSLPYLLAGVAGIFIYIASSDLIPDIHHRAGQKNGLTVLIPFITSIVLVGYLVVRSHG